MRTKLILGALSVVIIGAGTFTVSALQGQPEPSHVSQSSISAPDVNQTPETVAITAPNVNENPSDSITAPATVKPVLDTTPATETPKPVPEVHRDYCEASMPVGTLCLMRNMDGDLKGTVVYDEFNCKAAQVTQAENPNGNLATPSQTVELENCPQ